MFSDDFNGSALDTSKWTKYNWQGSVGVVGVASGTAHFPSETAATTCGKYTFTGTGGIVVESRMGGFEVNRDAWLQLMEVNTGDFVAASESNFWGGVHIGGTGQFASGSTAGGGSAAAMREYRMTLNGTTLKIERGETLANITVTHTVTLPSSADGKTFFLRIGTGGPDYQPGDFEWVRVDATAGTVNTNCNSSGGVSPIVNGRCGLADGIAVATAPTTNRCTTGTANPTILTGPGPWSWTCNGGGGGTNASCAAPLLPRSWAVKMLSDTKATPGGQVEGGPLGENNWGPFEPTVGAAFVDADVLSIGVRRWRVNGQLVLPAAPLQDGERFYRYDAENKLVLCTTAGRSATCVYLDVATHLLYSPEDAIPDRFTGAALVTSDGQPLGTRTPIILVHGWQGGGGLICIVDRDCSVGPAAMLHPAQTNNPQSAIAHIYWQNLLAFFAQASLATRYKVYVYKYPSYKHVTFNGRMLRKLVESSLELQGRNDLVFVAHSLGSIVTRSAFEEHGLPHTRASKIVTLDGVHHGSPAAIPRVVDGNTVPKNLATLGANDMHWDFYDGINTEDTWLQGKWMPNWIHSALGGNASNTVLVRELASVAAVEATLAGGTYSGSFQRAGSTVIDTATNRSVCSRTYSPNNGLVHEFEDDEYEGGSIRLGKTAGFDTHFRTKVDAFSGATLPIFRTTRGNQILRGGGAPIVNIARSVLVNPGAFGCIHVRPVVLNPWLLHLNLVHQTMPAAYRAKIAAYSGIVFDEQKDQHAFRLDVNGQLKLAARGVESLNTIDTGNANRDDVGYMNDGPVPTTSALLDMKLSFGEWSALTAARTFNGADVGISNFLSENVVTMYPGRVADAVSGRSVLGVDRIEPPVGACGGTAPLIGDIFRDYRGDGCIRHRLLGGYTHDMAINGCYRDGNDGELRTERVIWAGNTCWLAGPNDPNNFSRTQYVTQALAGPLGGVTPILSEDKLRWEPLYLSLLSDIAPTTPAIPWLAGIAVTPKLVFSPALINFGSQLTGSSSTFVLKVTNSGDVSVQNLVGVSAGGSVFSFSGGTCTNTLAPAASCTLNVNYIPTAAGAIEEVVRVSFDSAVAFALTLPVQARGVGLQAGLRTVGAPAAVGTGVVALSAVDAAGNVATSGCSVETFRPLGLGDGLVTSLAALPSTPPSPLIKFPWGLLEFRLNGCILGSSQRVKIDLPEPLPPNVQWAYWKASPTAQTPTWNAFGTAALPVPITVSADRRSVTFTLVDGGAGDADGIANGRIVDPGGIGIVDTTPDAFSFGAPIIIAANTVVESPPVGITGISDQAAISVVDGQYAVSTDGGLAWGAYTTAPGFVSPNNLVRARHTAAAQAGQATKTTVTVGGISGTFMSVVAGNLACSFDFNGDGVVDATDALLFNRWLLGFRGNALVDGIPAFPATSSKASFMVALRERLVIGAAHDLDGDGFVRAATDGLLLYRLVQSPTGSPVANNALGANPLRGTMNAIKTYAVTGCGANFQ